MAQCICCGLLAAGWLLSSPLTCLLSQLMINDYHRVIHRTMRVHTLAFFPQLVLNDECYTDSLSSTAMAWHVMPQARKARTCLPWVEGGRAWDSETMVLHAFLSPVLPNLPFCLITTGLCIFFFTDFLARRQVFDRPILFY